ncbi:hypothetical protein [Streptomyces tremellae]|uniref:Hydrogenase expression protein HypF n=1 Tax=Streptomyces tremellae TaxID=1124239 RepID=A0ABP7EM37_9ACTN
MRDDQTGAQALPGDAEEFRRATGPRHAARHAAPRKSLLTKFHVPAGKAMMLAAMPTAVFVGMGLTPRLALADDSTGKTANPNPCVSRSDDSEASGTASPSGSPSASATPGPSASTGATAHRDGGGTGTGKAGSSADPEPSTSADPSASATRKAPEPSQSSSAPGGGSGNGSGGGLLGGLGSALGGLLGGGSSSASPSDSPTPEATPSADASGATGAKAPGSTADTSTAQDKGAAPTGSLLGGSGKDAGDAKASDDSGDSGGGTAPGEDGDAPKKDASGSKAVKGTVGGLSKAKAGTAETRTQAIRDLLKQKGIPFSDTQPATKDSAEADSGSCDDGPCDNLLPILKPPSQDADAPSMATDAWHLTSSNLGLNGLCYRGLVDIKTASGTTKRVMKFTADSIDIKDLHQTVDNRDANGNIATHTQITTAPGSTSTIDGPVTMYTEKLSGNLLGLLPITFSPDFPPPIQIPSVFFTNAKVDQAGQFGGTLSTKGLHNTIG